MDDYKLSSLLEQTTTRSLPSSIHNVIEKKICALSGHPAEKFEPVSFKRAKAQNHNKSPQEEVSVLPSEIPGRLGPRVVQLSRNVNLGPLKLSDNDREVESHCHLGSILANVCVFEGKWQYEATLGTGGIQQIGWAPLTCPFSNSTGVGDSSDSYAFDGSRVTKWNDGESPYGQSWEAGDVIGVCLDLSKGILTYYRNGETLGVAFKKLRRGTSYFPAISLSYGEKCCFNFGHRPFEYPVETYSALQTPPLISASPTQTVLSDGPLGDFIAYLIDCLATLLSMEVRRTKGADTTWSQDDILIAASIVFEHLAPILTHEYYAVGAWYSFFVDCLESEDDLVGLLLHWMQLFMEPFEWQTCVHSLVKYFSYKCRTTGIMQVLKDSQSKNTTAVPRPPTRSDFAAFALVLKFFQNPTVLEFILSLDDFNSVMEHFVTLKQPTKADLAILLPFVWWQGGEGDYCSETHFLRDKELLNSCIRTYGDLVYELVYQLHNFSNTSETSATPFQKWLDFIVAKNKQANRNVVPVGLSQQSVFFNIYFALLRLLFDGTTYSVRPNSDAFLPLFCESREPTSDFTRMGGTFGYLQKTIPPVPMTQKSIPPAVFIFDAMILLYHLGVSSCFKANSQQQTSVRQLLARINEVKNKANADGIRANTSDLVENLVDKLRLMNYTRSVLVGADQSSSSTSIERHHIKQESMYRKMVFITDLILSTSQQTVFPYIPEYYLETMIDCFHSIRRAVPPLPLTSDLSYKAGLGKVIISFVTFFNDPRIVNPDLRDSLLQSIRVLVQSNEYFAFIESIQYQTDKGPLQEVLVHSLLQVYDKKSWVTISPILLRIWKGVGLGQGTITDPSPTVFQKAFEKVISQDKTLLGAFLNNIFNIFNTTISEFSSIKIDVTKMSNNDKQKANLLFELSVDLIRLLEIIGMKIPEAFQSELNMTRLVELLLLVLIRTTIGPDVVQLDGLLDVPRAWILAPLVGIVLNVEVHQPDTLVEAFEASASFNIEAFEYLLKCSWGPVLNSDVWLQKVEAFVHKLRNHMTSSASKPVTTSTSMEMCTICYSAAIDTTFEPCKHASCHKCISRHLLNNSKCFFCNAEVVSTRADETKK